MSYKNKTYVAFDGDNDIKYYNTMKMWKQNDNIDFNFYDAHDLNTAKDSSSEETIKRKLRERMNESKVFVILVGEHTKNLYKFVKWEIDTAIKLRLPIIVVNIYGSKKIDYDRCPPVLKDNLSIHINFHSKIMQYALENWPKSYYKHISLDELKPYYYKESVYEELGL